MEIVHPINNPDTFMKFIKQSNVSPKSFKHIAEDVQNQNAKISESGLL